MIVQERAQHLVVAAAGFVGAREDGADDLQPAAPAHTLVRDPVTRTDNTVGRSGVLECAYDCRAYGDDPSAPGVCVAYGRGCGCRNPISLIERKAPIERRVSGR